MKLVKKISFFTVLFALFISMFTAIRTKAATNYVQLTNPENGWQRIDETDKNIEYSGSWLTENSAISNSICWGGTHAIATSNTSKISFKFYGSKLRIIATPYHNKRNDNIIIIDNVSVTFPEYYSGTQPIGQRIVYENITLEEGMHTVVIKPSASMSYPTENLVIDALDIDDNGYLIYYNTSTLLKVKTVNNSVELSWDRVIGAAEYNVKRATTHGGPFDTVLTFTPNVSNISGSSIIFTDGNELSPGTYYYVVSAKIDGTESPNSNEVSATINKPEALGNNAILEITTINGSVKEYDLTAAELNDFLTWYDGRSNGLGKTYYKMPKKYNVKPFLSRNEYISFNKITCFEVKEYIE